MKFQRKVTWHKKIEDDRSYPIGEFCCEDLRQRRLGFNQEFNLCPFCGEEIERLPVVSEETSNPMFEEIFPKEDKTSLKDIDLSLEKLLSLCHPEESHKSPDKLLITVGSKDRRIGEITGYKTFYYVNINDKKVFSSEDKLEANLFSAILKVRLNLLG